jgi:hypothetical protein
MITRIAHYMCLYTISFSIYHEQMRSAQYCKGQVHVGRGYPFLNEKVYVFWLRNE